MSVSSSFPVGCSLLRNRTSEMLDSIPDAPGDELDHTAYHSDFAHHVAGLRGVIWKLERSQNFREVNDPSWEAFRSGDWQRALDLLEDDREAVRTEARDNRRQGLQIKRVRVVERPLTPYVQWELHALRMLAEAGFELSVVPASEVAAVETRRQLPEVVIIGPRVLYEVRYLPDWTPAGAKRLSDPRMISAATAEISRLFDKGEPL